MRRFAILVVSFCTLLLTACGSKDYSFKPTDAGSDAATANCKDGIKNGTETDVDCGGSCSACQSKQHCLLGTDCVEGVCTNTTCTLPTCIDQVTNGSETDTDCGGPDCAPCQTGGKCAKPSDCKQGVCTAGV